MAYLDPDHEAEGDVAISTYPAAAAPANGVSMAAAIKWATDALTGANGVVTFPAAAAPANGVNLAEVLRAVYNLAVPTIATFETAIDDSEQTETTAFPILTIAPAAGAPLADVEVVFDLAKATTGFATVESTVTVQFAVERKVDGTNWRREAYVEAALSGTLAALRAARIPVGSVGVTEQARIVALFSADVALDIEIPGYVAYKGIAAPTITPVVAG